MNTTLANLHAQVDAATKKAVAGSGHTPPCCAGCFFCCSEPADSTSSEIRHALELLTPQERDALKERTRAWLKTFLAAGWQTRDPNSKTHAFDYRALKLWCPLLVNGLCSVYDRRPLACRVHIAMESKEGCEDDALRPRQKFAKFPGLVERFSAALWQALPDGGVEIMDHIGILLARELLNEDHPTNQRLTVTCSGETLTVERYDIEPEPV